MSFTIAVLQLDFKFRNSKYQDDKIYLKKEGESTMDAFEDD